MKKNIVKIVVGVIVIILLLLLISRTRSEDRPFNQIQLSGNNFIHNERFPSYYDTVLSVAMDQMGLTGHNVIVRELSDGARGQFDGELKAHIRQVGPDFYLFTQEMDRKESIEVLSHEVIHMQQYSSGDLYYDNGNVTWKGEVLELNSKEYEQRPWENDAFSRQSQLINLVEGLLWDNK